MNRLDLRAKMLVLHSTSRALHYFYAWPAPADTFSAPDRERAGKERCKLIWWLTFLGLAAVLALGLVVFGLAAALGFVVCAPSMR